jgi:putative transposase
LQHNTRVGDITFAVPQVREDGFYPQALEKGLQSEGAFTLALAEMYVQGVSTRKVKANPEELCGVSITSSAVSQAGKIVGRWLLTLVSLGKCFETL